MFKLSDTFRWPVRFKYARDGGYSDEKFTAKFKRIPMQEFMRRALLDDMAGEDRINAMTDLLLDVFVDFEEVEFDGEDRESIRRALIADTTVANATLDAYSEALTGGLREKN